MIFGTAIFVKMYISVSYWLVCMVVMTLWYIVRRDKWLLLVGPVIIVDTHHYYVIIASRLRPDCVTIAP